MKWVKVPLLDSRQQECSGAKEDVWRQSLLDKMKIPLEKNTFVSTFGDRLAGRSSLVHSEASFHEHKVHVRAYCMHVLDQVLKQRKLIMKNNESLSKDSTLSFKDQGFTRASVLVILPFRNTAFDFITTLSEIWNEIHQESCQIDNQKRLKEEFGPDQDALYAEANRTTAKHTEEFRHVFRANADDMFRIGIKVTRKSLKLFSDFYSADIIIASPLGLRMVIEGTSERKMVTAKKSLGKRVRKRIVKKGDYDFLSSIKTVVVDQADVIAMQNWDHLVYVMENLNKIPITDHGSDFSRIAKVFLDGRAATERQSIFFSKYMFPDLSNLLLLSSTNNHGIFALEDRPNPGILKTAFKSKGLKPEFHLVDSKRAKDIPSTRLKYFSENLLPSLSQGSCIFVSSYFDFVQVRDLLQQKGVSHSILSEYCTPQETSAARTMFFNKKVDVLVVSERFHFFKDYRIRGITSGLLFYSLPENHDYFSQWINMIEEEDKQNIATIPIIITKYEYIKEESIIGTQILEKLLS